MDGLCVRGLRYAYGLHRSTGARLDSHSLPPRSLPARRGPRIERLESRVLLAAPVPAGSEFRVNTHTPGDQQLFAEAPHAVAADADGDFVVTWSSSGQDGSGWGVYAQRYGADGAGKGSEFRVNQSTAGDQWFPGVASDAAGNFVVAWTSAGQDGNGDGVYARRYAASGAPLGGEFRVNTTTANHQRHATVATSAAGGFVIAWSGFGQAGGAGWDVYAQRYDAGGARQGGEFRVNATTAADQQYAAVAADHAGNYIVTWTTDAQDGGGTAVYARRYGATGAALSGEFRVNTTTAGDQQYSRVAADSGGSFVIAWASAGQDGSARGIYAQRYTAAGAKTGGEFRVNQVTAGEQFAPTVASDDAGGFIITWTGSQDGDQFGVFARAYEASGSSRGGEFRVNTYLAGNQVYAAAASSADGRIVIVWQSEKQDGSWFGVYGQRYASPDTDAPTADIVDVAPDPRNTAVATVKIAFSEPVIGVDRTDFTLTRNGGPNLLTAAQTISSADGGATRTLWGLSSLTADDGTYLLTLDAAGTGIADAAGNALAGGASEQWVMDAVRPAADVIDVAPDPRETAVGAITLRFSEPVTGLDRADLRLTRDGLPGNLLTAAQTLSSADNVTFTLGNLAALTGVPGTYLLTVVATGSGIMDAAGNALGADASDRWTVTAPPPPARVVGRHVFYNGSSFDGRDGAANARDDAAIAPDKRALLPGEAAGFANYTSDPRGLNGVMIDLADWSAAGAAPGLSPADFDFRVGQVADLSRWVPAPRPTSISIRPGAGAGGSDRVTLVWPDGAMTGGWLQLTMLATPATRLPAPDVFFFGNLPGETGDRDGAAVVTASDLFGTRAAISGAAAGPASRFDHNRDGRVNVRDLAAVRSAVGGPPLQLIGPSIVATAAAPTSPRRTYRPPTAADLLTE